MSNKYITYSSGFFYVNGETVQLLEKGWKAIVSEKNRLLCLNNLDNYRDDGSDVTEITIGQRHENGDGLHCLITVDNIKEIVTFESDIAGGVPVFWFAKNDIIIVASGIELLINLTKNLGIHLKPNLHAFSELLIASYIYTEMQTGVEDVQLLPPKTKLIINCFKNKIELQKTASEFTYSEDVLEWEDAKKVFREALIVGFKRNEGKKVACLLSGGADSRIAALSAIKSGIAVDFYTFGQSTVNVSDFYVASHIGYKLGKKVHCYSTSPSDFITNWKHACSRANWINDSVWWAGRIPEAMFSELQKYDVIIRGDGDGIYGWKTAVANISDILHRLEISEIGAVKKYFKYFEDSDSIFKPAEASRKELVDKYERSKNNLRDLKNILYQKIREPRGIAPGIWHFSRLTAIDAPLLWEKSFNVATRIPNNKRYDKQIIFDVLKTYDEVKNVPFSQGGSWDNQLEFYYSGVWEELLDYVKTHSPFPVKYDELRKNYIKPSVIDIKVKSPFHEASNKIKKQILGSDLGRKTAFKYFSHLTHSSMADRLIIRLALMSNLCELISIEKQPDIVSNRIRQ
jgi:hypothetical protein